MKENNPNQNPNPNQEKQKNDLCCQTFESLHDCEIVNALKAWTKTYARSEHGKWLNEFEWNEIPVKIVRFQTWQFSFITKDIMGLMFFGTICLTHCEQPEMLFGTYIHELRHVWQSKMNFAVYLVGKLYRPIIEDDARKEESYADDWINNAPVNIGNDE